MKTKNDMTMSAQDLPTLRVLGTRVNPVQMSDALSLIEGWIQERGQSRFIVASGMHAVMEARRNPVFKEAVESADLFVPDGISLVWTARIRGFPIKNRVCGLDLMWEFFKIAEQRGYRNFFYGDTEETLQDLEASLKVDFPDLQIAGMHSPPFRALTAEEDQAEIDLINRSGADIVWVGLGLPKQETWIFQHRDALNPPVAVGVGAAFKFLSGTVKRAPSSVGNHGLEWLWRFFQEPRRVWRRVFIDSPRFVGCLMLELTGLKKFD